MPSLFSKPERFICDSVVYGEYAYRVDRRKSSLAAFVAGERLWWTLDIYSLDCEYPSTEERCPPASAPHLDLTIPDNVGPRQWRDLEYKSFKFEFADDETFPLLPDIPSGAYIGYHHSCTKHQISFGARQGVLFELRWKPLAKADEYDPGTFFYVDAYVPFTGIHVAVDPKGYDLSAIKLSLGKWFDLNEFKRPNAKKRHAQLVFDIKPTIDADDA